MKFMMKTPTRLALAVSFLGAGVTHFVRPQFFEAIVPPYLPFPHALVLISGAAEIAGGAGLLLPATRRAAGWGLVALLLAVFPANLYMWQVDVPVDGQHLPRWALLARLPLQFVLIAAVLWSAKDSDK